MKCQYCGCTDERACEGGCQWVTEDICSKCVGTHVRYLIRMLSWNGHGFDINGKNVKTQKEVMGILSLTLREIRPTQITITDLKEIPSGYKVKPVEIDDSVPAAAHLVDHDLDRIITTEQALKRIRKIIDSTLTPVSLCKDRENAIFAVDVLLKHMGV